MCKTSPQKVSISKKSALDRAANEFGLMTGEDIKSFIVDGLENPYQCKSSDSNQLSRVRITAYKFSSGRKNGYLAFHRSVGSLEGIHIKSFHLDDTNPSLGTLGDLFNPGTLRGKK